MQKRKNQFHWKRITVWRGELACRTGFTRSKSITVHAAVGPTTVPIQGGERGEREKRLKFSISLILLIVWIVFERNSSLWKFILFPSFSHIFCYQLFLKLRILFILVDISSFFLFYFSIIYFFLSSFFFHFSILSIILKLYSKYEYSNLSANSKKKNNFNYRGIGLIFLKILKFADRLN